MEHSIYLVRTNESKQANKLGELINHSVRTNYKSSILFPPCVPRWAPYLKNTNKVIYLQENQNISKAMRTLALLIGPNSLGAGHLL